MITHLPFPNFAESAACLDRQTLGKQRLETLQIAKCLAGVPSSWKNHPAVKMWRGYERALLRYQEAVVYEWTVNRGYSDGAAGDTPVLEQTQMFLADVVDTGDPVWLGDEEVHLSHQSNLLRKDKAHYKKFFDVADDLSYVWPELVA